MTTQNQSNVLATRAMLAFPSIRMWSARKLDKRVTDETNVNHGAQSDVARVNKLLVPKEALAPMEKIAGGFRTFHYSRTLPWIHKGADLLPSAIFDEYTARARNDRHEFESEMETFFNRYDSDRADAPRRMNGLYNAADYPPAQVLRERFGFGVTIFPVPSVADFRTQGISDSAMAEIRDNAERELNRALESAMADVWNRIQERVAAMSAKLKGYKPGEQGERAESTFRDSLVENVRELVALLPALNITGDSNLASIAARMQRELCAENADALRDNADARKSVQQSAESILADVAAYIA